MHPYNQKRKELAEKVKNLPNEIQEEIYYAMKEYRFQHRLEQFISGWSKKYNELMDKANEVVQSYLGQLDYYEKEEVWSILSDKFFYSKL